MLKTEQMGGQLENNCRTSYIYVLLEQHTNKQHQQVFLEKWKSSIFFFFLALLVTSIVFMFGLYLLNITLKVEVGGTPCTEQRIEIVKWKGLKSKRAASIQPIPFRSFLLFSLTTMAKLLPISPAKEKKSACWRLFLQDLFLSKKEKEDMMIYILCFFI